MGFPPKVYYLVLLFSFCFLSLIHPSFSLTDVHDLLPLYNLPKGLLPSNTKSYSLSNTDNTFTIELSTRPCYVKFNDQLVCYDRIIKGKLEYGKVSGVSGIQAKKFFIWISVTGINVVGNTGIIEFSAGSFSQRLPAGDFFTIHSCKGEGLREPLSLLEASI